MSKCCEAGPEEGEIIDDDLEEISDSSMILNETGKSLYHNDHLPVISLSSISDVDEEATRMHKMKRFRKLHGYRHHRGHHQHHHHREKRRMKGKYHKKKKWKKFLDSYSTSSESNSDSESSFDLELDRKLQNQLKAAIRVQKQDDSHKNSLKTRLRAMTKVNELLEPKSGSPKSENDDKVEEKQNSEETDNELIQLRLEALKTAVLNKLEHRKKRKVKEMEANEDAMKTNNLETNKENSGNENIQFKKSCLDKPDSNTTPPEEDEDVLRALLLASMSKKITKDESKKKEISKKTDPSPVQNIIKANVFVKKPNMPLRQHIPPKIKPIIININTDSETDDDKCKAVSVPSTNSIPKNPDVIFNKVNSEIESTVEKFLKEQRAKVEAQTLPKELVSVQTKLKITGPQKPDDSVILEKSAVRLLPKVKQIEYQKLLQKLKNAQKKPKVKKNLLKGGEETHSIRKIVRNKVHSPTKSCVGNKIEKMTDIKQDARTLHSALKQMQKQKDGRMFFQSKDRECFLSVIINGFGRTTFSSGRGGNVLKDTGLQIEEKYIVLTPIIRKINETTMERKKYDLEVKRLMNELAEAKRKLLVTHRNFSTCVKELITEKEDIDKSELQEMVKINGEVKLPHTSTPNKVKLPLEPLDMSSVPNTPYSRIDTPKESPMPGTYKLPNDSTVSESVKNGTKVDSDILQNDIVVIKSTQLEVIYKKNVAGSCDIEDINPGDPNDIHRIYEKQGVLKYISPLDSIKRDSDYDDPFVIMCPYDVDGNCRDPECTYKHYSR